MMPRPSVKSHLILAMLPYTCAIVGPLLATTGLASPRIGFFIFLSAAGLGVLNALLGLIHIFRRKFLPAVVMGVGILPLLLMLSMASMTGKAPLINDITTDLDDPVMFVKAPEAFDNQGKDFAYPPEFIEQQKSGYPGLGPLVIQDITPRQVLVRVRAIVKAMDNTEIVYQGENILEATQTSSLFRFVDDFVVRAESTPTGTRIDIRSRSRIGQGDLGANARRIEAIFAELRKG